MNTLLKLIGGSKVEPDEWPAVRLLLVHSLALGVFRAFYVSFANAQFLADFEVSTIPIGFLASGFIGYLAVLAFSRLQRRIPFSLALLVDLGFVLFLTAGFWAGFVVSDSRWVSFALFAWMGPVQALVDLEFWGVAGRLFNLQQSKRLFGLIGAGEALASIAGFFIVPFLFALAGDPAILLLLAAGALGVCIFVLMKISRRFKHQLADPATQAAGEQPVSRFKADRYFLLISVVAVGFILTMYSVDFAFLAIVREQFGSREAIGGFVGIFFGLAKTAELLSKLFFSGWLLRQFGVIAGLMVMPVAVLMCMLPASAVGMLAGTGAVAFFLLIAAAKFLEFGLRKSVFEPSSRVLYQPLPSDQRFAAQTRVDGLVKQVAVGVIGGLLALFSLLGPTGLVVVAAFLVLVAAGWLAVTRPLFYEYRSKLLAILSSLPKKALLASPVELIRRRLGQSPAAEVGYSLNVLRNIEPGLMGEIVVELLESDRPEVRLEALGAIERAHWMSAADAVSRRAREEPEPEVRLAAERTARVLAALRLEEMTPAKVVEHAASADPRLRLLAALALVRQPENVPADLLGDLLWDDDRRVRRAAVAAAGLSGQAQLWPRLVDLLGSGEFFKSAVSALVRIGEPAFDDLELGFKKFGQDAAAMCRVLRVYRRIGGPEAERLLFEKVEYPHRDVQRQVLTSLGVLGFSATPEQSTAIMGHIEATIDTISWYVAGIRDLREEPRAAGLVTAMEEAVGNQVEFVFLLLALICDPQAIQLMQEHLSGGGAEDRAFALEIAEQLVPEESRELVFPILEDLPPQQLLERLRFYFPQRRLGVSERLLDILSQGSAKVDSWVRATAIYSLSLLDLEEVPAELAANLYSADPMTRELAARSLWRIDPAEYRRRLVGLALGDRQALEQVMPRLADDGGAPTEQLLIYDKTLLLGQTPMFAGLPNPLLADFAARTLEDRFEADTTVFREGDPGRDMYIVVEGRLRIDKDGQTLSHVEEREPLGEIAVVEATTRSASAIAVEPTHLLRIGSNTILDLMAEHMEIMPLIVQTIAERRARG